MSDTAVAEVTSEPLDLTRPSERKSGDNVQLQDVGHHTLLWAEVVRPFTYLVFALITFVVVLPFLLIAQLGTDDQWTKKDQLAALIQWATTVLPPSVGFGSAVIGYYFGTRGGTTRQAPPGDGTSRAGGGQGPADD